MAALQEDHNPSHSWISRNVHYVLHLAVEAKGRITPKPWACVVLSIRGDREAP